LDTVNHFSDPLVTSSWYNIVISTGPTVWGLKNEVDIKKDETPNSIIVHLKNKAARYILIQQLVDEIQQLEDDMFIFNVCEVKVYATKGIMVLLFLNFSFQKCMLICASRLIFEISTLLAEVKAKTYFVKVRVLQLLPRFQFNISIQFSFFLS
jgi:hypothetical protein